MQAYWLLARGFLGERGVQGYEAAAPSQLRARVHRICFALPRASPALLHELGGMIKKYPTALTRTRKATA